MSTSDANATPRPTDDARNTGASLTIVPGPIGNLRDITLRALETLREADVIACEDTRHSRRLLDRHEIRGPRLISCHEHNEARRAAEIVALLRSGRRVALLSDAGMPGISDPGGRIVQACLREDLPVEVLPGPSAPVTAVVGSGLFADRFHFGGFLPPKSGRRERTLREALERQETSVFFESPHRLGKTLDLLEALEPGRPVCVARELTKAHEEYVRGTAATVAERFRNSTPRGEITLIIAGRDLPKWITLGDPDPKADRNPRGGNRESV